MLVWHLRLMLISVLAAHVHQSGPWANSVTYLPSPAWVVSRRGEFAEWHLADSHLLARNGRQLSTLPSTICLFHFAKDHACLGDDSLPVSAIAVGVGRGWIDCGCKSNLGAVGPSCRGYGVKVHSTRTLEAFAKPTRGPRPLAALQGRKISIRSIANPCQMRGEIHSRGWETATTPNHTQ